MTDVEECELQYPETTSEFKRIMQEQYELFCKKQLDYGPGNIAVGTNLQTEQEKDVALMGVWFRMSDKIQRLKNMVVLGSTNVHNESIEDSYKDLSNYSVICQIVKNGKWGG